MSYRSRPPTWSGGSRPGAGSRRACPTRRRSCASTGSRAWARVYAPRRLAVVRAGDALGLLELGAGRRWRFAGRPGDEHARAARGGRRGVGRVRRLAAGARAAVGDARRRGHPAGRAAGRRDASRRRRRCSRCPASLDEYLAGRSRYRRILRRLAREGAVLGEARGRPGRARRLRPPAPGAGGRQGRASPAGRRAARAHAGGAALGAVVRAARARAGARRPPAGRLDRARAREHRLVLQPRHRPRRARARARHRAPARVDPRGDRAAAGA